MYAGFSYASIEYAASRVPASPVIKLLARTIQSVYGIGHVLLLRFRNLIVPEFATDPNNPLQL